jgi:hypothetical protein
MLWSEKSNRGSTIRHHIQRFLRRVATCITLLFIAQPLMAIATTVEETTVEEALENSKLVFEGKVVEVWSGESPHGIHTWVRFEILDIIKGPNLGPTVTFRFRGGQVGELREEVIGMNVPEVGEVGIYFMESLSRFQVNPLYGWDQGRLPIVADQRGKRRMVSAQGHPVTGVGPAHEGPRGLGTGSGVARGLTENPHGPLESALTPETLKAAFRASLKEAK